MIGWLLMGLPGLAYLAGFDAVWLGRPDVGTYLNWKFIAAPLRVPRAARRLAHHARLRRAPLQRPLAHLRTITAAFILVFFTFYASRFVATALFGRWFGMDYHDAMFWGSILMLANVLRRLLAVSWSDVLPGHLMFFRSILWARWRRLPAGSATCSRPSRRATRRCSDPSSAAVGEALASSASRRCLAWASYPGQPQHPRALHGDPSWTRSGGAPVAMGG